MTRGTTQAERDAAVTVISAGSDIPLDDIESAFEDWRASFEHATEPGKIRAFQIPIDERGNINVTAKTQTRLGSWAIDLYDFDELCGMIIRDFMLPFGEKIMAVRFIGTKSGERGVQFNKTVILRAPQGPAPGAANQPQPESTASLLKAVQEGNERTLQLLTRLTPPPAEKPDQMAEMMRMAQFMHTLQAPQAEMTKALILAIAGRPAAPMGGDPFAGLSGALGVVEKLKELTSGGGDGGNDTSSDWVQALKAIMPIAKPALEAIPAIAAATMQARASAPQRPPIDATATPSEVKPPERPAAAPGNATDIPSGDSAVFAQLKPQIDSLVNMAQQGSDPAAAADLLFDQVLVDLPDEMYARVADIVAGANFVKNAAVFNPAVSQHTEFFEKFRTQILKRIEEEDAIAGQAPTGG